MTENDFRQQIREHLRATRADKFGRFGFSLQLRDLVQDLNSAENDSPGLICTNDSVAFVFTISGTGPFSESDFGNELSETPPGSIPSNIAAKFIHGPFGDDAFGASATGNTLSEASSAPFVDVSWLGATFQFEITGATELTLVVQNNTEVPYDLDISEIYFNAASHVTDLSLDSATHDTNGDVLGSWSSVLSSIE